MQRILSAGLKIFKNRRRNISSVGWRKRVFSLKIFMVASSFGATSELPDKSLNAPLMLPSSTLAHVVLTGMVLEDAFVLG